MIQHKYKATNSRRHKRLDASYLLKYQMIGTGEAVYLSNLKDLSAGGIRFWSEQHVPEGSMLSLHFLVPPLGRSIRAFGKVQRSRFSNKNGVFYVSVMFVEIQAADQLAIEQMVEDICSFGQAKSLVNHADVVTRTAYSSVAL